MDENEFEDDNEKSCSRFKKGLPLKSFLEPIGLKSPTRQFGSELQKIFEIPWAKEKAKKNGAIFILASSYRSSCDLLWFILGL